MNKEVMNRLQQALSNHKNVALVTVTDAIGSGPSRVGQNMLVYENGDIKGSVGGGSIEASVIEKALECIRLGESQSFSYQLSNLGMSCGGSAKGFIQVATSNNRLLVIGGGHIGQKIYEIGKLLDFHITVIDDREAFSNAERFPDAETKAGKISEMLKDVTIDGNTYVVIATKGHLSDYEALKFVVTKNPKYLGLIGSKKKTRELFDRLRKDGLGEENISNVYGPVGLDIAKEDPGEIAVSIFAEILLMKNSGTLQHMKDKVKK